MHIAEVPIWVKYSCIDFLDPKPGILEFVEKVMVVAQIFLVHMKLSPKQFSRSFFVLVMTIFKLFTISFPNPPNQYGTVKNLQKNFITFFKIESHFGHLHQWASCKAH